ncbi:MAG: hypothetical protein J6H21_06635 [Firmicutes bacterium]|nr:hypothetical protein [Bacillota bacterium]
MRKIKCICMLDDKNYNEALKHNLLYSGFFTVIDDAFAQDEYYSEPELIYFVDRYDGKRQPKSFVVELMDWNEVRGSHQSEEKIFKKYKNKVLTLFKYICFSRLLLEVFSNLEFKTEGDLPGQLGGTKPIMRISVVGTAGGIGTTEIARACGTILFRNGYKPLCLDLSPISFPGARAEDMENVDITGMMYNLKRRKPTEISIYTNEINGAQWLRRGIINKYIEYFDVQSLERLGLIAKEEGYEILLLDLGTQLQENTREIIKKSDVAIFVFPLIEEWIREDMHGLEEILDMGPGKSFAIINDYKGKARDELLDDLERKDSIDLIIPWCGELTERSVDLEFGNEIRYLVNKITDGTYGQ